MSGGSLEPEIHLADVDPELFAGLTARDLDEARVRAVVPTLAVERGRWDATELPVTEPEGCLGLLVLDGLLLRSVTVSGAPRSELVGPGDLIRPWDRDEVATVPFDSRWQAVQPTLVRHALLADRRSRCSPPRWGSSTTSRALWPTCSSSAT